VTHSATLISDSVSVSQTRAEATSPLTRGQCVAWSDSSLRQYQVVRLGDRGNIDCLKHKGSISKNQNFSGNGFKDFASFNSCFYHLDIAFVK